MTTVREKIDNDAQHPLASVIGRYGSNDLPTALEDYLADTMHALYFVWLNEEDTPDPRMAVLSGVERAVANWWAEQMALAQDPDGNADGLGGYHNPTVTVEIGEA